MKEGVIFPVNNFEKIKYQMLNWANQFSIFCFLDNNNYHFSEPAFECLLAAGCKHSIRANAGNAFDQLKKFNDQHSNEWLFGHFGFDLKNEIESLRSAHYDGIKFPDLFFFIPEIIIKLNRNEMMIFAEGYENIIAEEIFSIKKITGTKEKSAFNLKNRVKKEEYISTVKKLQAHMLRGDCFEINFCQEFYDDHIQIDPIEVFSKLCVISPNPFAVLYKLDDKFCIGASPERYLKKSGSSIFSQPIKGTAKRNLSDTNADEKSRQYLINSSKEKSENVMVVDLVRNDLSRICKEGTVIVDELFGIYSFPQVHQMISTISGKVKEDIHWTEMIKATFPMGSMTGAPKKRVLELIEQYEKTRRGLYSGAIGFVDPKSDFDFNVVIRSLLYNQTEQYLSFQAGGAITYYSDPVAEYEECLLKVSAIKETLD